MSSAARPSGAGTADAAPVAKTSIRLSDGRELLYFDDPATPPREHPAADRTDRRDLEPVPALARQTTMRADRLTGEWVTVAQQRQGRTFLPPDDQCPLCPSTATRLTEIPAADYDVVVFENRFPSFAGPPPDATPPQDPRGPVSVERGGLFVDAPGAGRCEVVCFTADHDAAFSSLTPTRARTVIEAWCDRTVALSATPGVEQVFCFENRGREIGVTLNHPHGQIYGYPFVAPRLRQMLDQARRHRAATGGDLLSDLLAAEIASGERIVTRTEHWTAFVPYAARWPLEVHLYPNRKVPDLPALTDAERDDLSRAYLDVLRRMEAVHDDTLPYIAGWYQAPVRVDRDLAYLHLQVMSIRRAPGKLKYLAGSESAMGAFVNDVSPEQASQALRDARPTA